MCLSQPTNWPFQLVAQGIHVVTAAGNENDDAANWSPARTPGAITVGATDFGDNRFYFSNYGPIVDVFAPGVNIVSAGITSPTVRSLILLCRKNSR